MRLAPATALRSNARVPAARRSPSSCTPSKRCVFAGRPVIAQTSRRRCTPASARSVVICSAETSQLGTAKARPAVICGSLLHADDRPAHAVSSDPGLGTKHARALRSWERRIGTDSDPSTPADPSRRGSHSILQRSVPVGVHNHLQRCASARVMSDSWEKLLAHCDDTSLTMTEEVLRCAVSRNRCTRRPELAVRPPSEGRQDGHRLQGARGCSQSVYL